jgi:hypothetical protein
MPGANPSVYHRAHIYTFTAISFHIRPDPLENTGSRPLSHSQAGEGRLRYFFSPSRDRPPPVRPPFSAPHSVFYSAAGMALSAPTEHGITVVGGLAIV